MIKNKKSKKVKKIDLKLLKKENKEPLINKNYIKICPNCGSKNVDYYTDSYRRQYRCDDCNFFANEFPEIKKTDYKKDSKKIKENVKNSKINKLKINLTTKITISIIIALSMWMLISVVAIPFIWDSIKPTAAFMNAYTFFMHPDIRTIFSGIIILLLLSVWIYYTIKTHKKVK